MRLPLLAAALAAVAATAVPADAAYYPVCATHLDAAAYGVVRSCSTGNNPIGPATRILDVDVHTGVVEATLTCFTPWNNSTVSGTYVAGESGRLTLGENRNSCTATLRSLSSLTTATGVSTFTPRIYTGPTP